MKLTKNQKLGLLAIPVLIGAYLIYRQFAKPKGDIGKYTPPPSPKPVITPQRTITQNSAGCNYPLKKGVYNCDLVKQLQWALNHIPYTKYDSTTNLVKYRPLKEDGDFGAKTEAVLSDFWINHDTLRYYSKEVLNEDEMDLIMANVIEDPAAFQAAENRNIIAPPPAAPCNPLYEIC
jgi:hypothetical protein